MALNTTALAEAMAQAQGQGRAPGHRHRSTRLSQHFKLWVDVVNDCAPQISDSLASAGLECMQQSTAQHSTVQSGMAQHSMPQHTVDSVALPMALVLVQIQMLWGQWLDLKPLMCWTGATARVAGSGGSVAAAAGSTSGGVAGAAGLGPGVVCVSPLPASRMQDMIGC